MTDLGLHVQMVHVISSQQATPVAPPRMRPAQIPRPELPEEATEQEWAHWKVKWERYKRSCLQGLDKTTVVDHLWACCPKDLESSIWKQVGQNLDTEEELLELMLRLGVKKRNVLLNKVAFLDMCQREGEPAKLFVARLKGQAAVCDFTLPEGTSDYTDQMVQHQLIRGLSDEGIQEHILAHAATTEGSKMDLTMTVNMVEAKECGKQDTESLQKASTVNRLSDYKKGFKFNQGEDVSKSDTRVATSDNVCTYCCRTGHGNGSHPEVRQKLCPAFGRVCGKCGKMDHFQQACRKRDGALNKDVKDKRDGAENKDVKDNKEDGVVDFIGVGEAWTSEDEDEDGKDLVVGSFGSFGGGTFCAMSAMSPPVSRKGGTWYGGSNPGPAHSSKEPPARESLDRTNPSSGAAC